MRPRDAVCLGTLVPRRRTSMRVSRLPCFCSAVPGALACAHAFRVLAFLTTSRVMRSVLSDHDVVYGGCDPDDPGKLLPVMRSGSPWRACTDVARMFQRRIPAPSIRCSRTCTRSQCAMATGAPIGTNRQQSLIFFSASPPSRAVRLHGCSLRARLQAESLRCVSLRDTGCIPHSVHCLRRPVASACVLAHLPNYGRPGVCVCVRRVRSAGLSDEYCVPSIASTVIPKPWTQP